MTAYVKSFTKDPDAVLDYTISWVHWLASGDTIDSSTWTVPAGLTLDSSSDTTTTSTAWISGGTDGTTYYVSCLVTTTGGRTDERTIRIVVSER